MEEELRVVSTASTVVEAVVEVLLSSDLAGLDQVKAGRHPVPATPARDGATVV